MSTPTLEQGHCRVGRFHPHLGPDLACEYRGERRQVEHRAVAHAAMLEDRIHGRPWILLGHVEVVSRG